MRMRLLQTAHNKICTRMFWTTVFSDSRYRYHHQPPVLLLLLLQQQQQKAKQFISMMYVPASICQLCGILFSFVCEWEVLWPQILLLWWLFEMTLPTTTNYKQTHRRQYGMPSPNTHTHTVCTNRTFIDEQPIALLVRWCKIRHGGFSIYAYRADISLCKRKYSLLQKLNVK